MAWGIVHASSELKPASCNAVNSSLQVFKGTSKNSSFARANQRDPLQQLEWMGPKATPGPIFRGALKLIFQSTLADFMTATNNPHLNLINLFPITTAPPTPLTRKIFAITGRELLESQVLESPESLLAAIIQENGTSGAAHNAVCDALKSCKAYRKWQSSMPWLKDVPHIKNYRKASSSADLHGVNQEVLRHGGYLSAEQVLYSGGSFGSEIIQTLNRPLSTTMNPSVARYHAHADGGQIAILTIKTNMSVRGFAYRTNGNQGYKQEYEVLLQANLRLEQTSAHEVGGFQVKLYEVDAEQPYNQARSS